MTPRALAFPYEPRALAPFGTIYRPVAHAELYSAAFHRWLAYTVLVDTGADYCVFPAAVAQDLGIALTACEPHIASGVGGPQRIFLHRRTRLRLGMCELIVPVGFIRSDAVPPLLGRYRCLDTFDLRLAHRITTFRR